MVSQEKMKYLYMIGKIFVNSQYILKTNKVIRDFLNVYVYRMYIMYIITILQVMKVNKRHNRMPQEFSK